jgi:lysozyme family protein
MAQLKDSIHLLLTVEGGWVNDPTDRGKETYSGISRKWYPGWPGWIIVDRMKAEPRFPANLKTDKILSDMVFRFYDDEYWKKLGLEDVADKESAEEIFEMAVNFGIEPAVKIVQEAVNLLNKAGKEYADISVDGDVGPNTIDVVNKYRINNKPFIRTVNGLQFERYVEICRKDKSQEKFFHGWLTRT